eukprot:TRINITY_DN893_c2_g1_i4.p1 TRINITY_DN893_c2_g1~~TRINITY_DN893_c2_g1_i4.p1  ORF type:complete len:1053 (+),score=219.79 TRINITY_DN893_c2_g1_i4:49-3207(+)
MASCANSTPLLHSGIVGVGIQRQGKEEEEEEERRPRGPPASRSGDDDQGSVSAKVEGQADVVAAGCATRALLQQRRYMRNATKLDRQSQQQQQQQPRQPHSSQPAQQQDEAWQHNWKKLQQEQSAWRPTRKTSSPHRGLSPSELDRSSAATSELRTRPASPRPATQKPATPRAKESPQLEQRPAQQVQQSGQRPTGSAGSDGQPLATGQHQVPAAKPQEAGFKRQTDLQQPLENPFCKPSFANEGMAGRPKSPCAAKQRKRSSGSPNTRGANWSPSAMAMLPDTSAASTRGSQWSPPVAFPQSSPRGGKAKSDGKQPAKEASQDALPSKAVHPAAVAAIPSPARATQGSVNYTPGSCSSTSPVKAVRFDLSATSSAGSCATGRKGSNELTAAAGPSPCHQELPTDWARRCSAEGRLSTSRGAPAVCERLPATPEGSGDCGQTNAEEANSDSEVSPCEVLRAALEVEDTPPPMSPKRSGKAVNMESVAEKIIGLAVADAVTNAVERVTSEIAQPLQITHASPRAAVRLEPVVDKDAAVKDASGPAPGRPGGRRSSSPPACNQSASGPSPGMPAATQIGALPMSAWSEADLARRPQRQAAQQPAVEPAAEAVSLGQGGGGEVSLPKPHRRHRSRSGSADGAAVSTACTRSRSTPKCGEDGGGTCKQLKSAGDAEAVIEVRSLDPVDVHAITERFGSAEAAGAALLDAAKAMCSESGAASRSSSCSSSSSRSSGASSSSSSSVCSSSSSSSWSSARNVGYATNLSQRELLKALWCAWSLPEEHGGHIYRAVVGEDGKGDASVQAVVDLLRQSLGEMLRRHLRWRLLSTSCDGIGAAFELAARKCTLDMGLSRDGFATWLQGFAGVPRLEACILYESLPAKASKDSMRKRPTLQDLNDSLRSMAPWCTLGRFFARLWSLPERRCKESLVDLLQAFLPNLRMRSRSREARSASHERSRRSSRGRSCERGAAATAVTREVFSCVCRRLDLSPDNEKQIWGVLFGCQCSWISLEDFVNEAAQHIPADASLLCAEADGTAERSAQTHTFSCDACHELAMR